MESSTITLITPSAIITEYKTRTHPILHDLAGEYNTPSFIKAYVDHHPKKRALQPLSCQISK